MTTAERTVQLGGAGGVVLIVLGIVAYVLTDFASVTALIPSIFGVVFLGLGVVGREPSRQRRSAYALGVFGLVGLGGSTRGLGDAVALLTGGSVDSPIAAASQGLMAVVCLAIVVSVVYFAVQERRR